MIASLHSYSQTINIQSDDPENGKCKFSVSSKLIDMYKLNAYYIIMCLEKNIFCMADMLI